VDVVRCERYWHKKISGSARLRFQKIFEGSWKARINSSREANQVGGEYFRNMELCTAIHAEERAILSLGDRSADGGTLYVTTFPCFQCARLILDTEIENIVYVEAYPVQATAEFLKANGVTIKPFSGFTARAFFRVFPKVS